MVTDPIAATDSSQVECQVLVLDALGKGGLSSGQIVEHSLVLSVDVKPAIDALMKDGYVQYVVQDTKRIYYRTDKNVDELVMRAITKMCRGYRLDPTSNVVNLRKLINTKNHMSLKYRRRIDGLKQSLHSIWSNVYGLNEIMSKNANEIIREASDVLHEGESGV